MYSWDSPSAIGAKVLVGQSGTNKMESKLTKTLEEYKADFASYPIMGFAGEGQYYVRTPLFTQLTDNLWMGGTPAEMYFLPDMFEAVLNLHVWDYYGYNKLDVEYRAVQMYDSLSMPNMEFVNGLADWVEARLRKGKTTLVHCQAGLNRSGLVAGVVLTRLGMTPQQALDHMREKRSGAVLCNGFYEEALLNV